MTQTTTVTTVPANKPVDIQKTRTTNNLAGTPSPAKYSEQVKRKTVLRDESREFSVFFMIGIAINIIMAATFAWWFSREWRRSGK